MLLCQIGERLKFEIDVCHLKYTKMQPQNIPAEYNMGSSGIKNGTLVYTGRIRSDQGRPRYFVPATATTKCYDAIVHPKGVERFLADHPDAKFLRYEP